MKKIFLLSALIVSLCAFRANAQVYEQGNVVVDAYYGFPNLATTFLKAGYQASIDAGYYPGFKMTSIGPVGVKAEYLLSDKVGFGLNVNTAITSIKSGYLSGATTYNYTASYNRLRIMGMLNFHFGQSDKVDPYLAVGGGYITSKLQEHVNIPGYVSGASLKNLVPVCIRIEFGTRYYFTDHFGISAQVGLGGGPILAAGLCGKF